ncbi:SET domain-containing protein 3 [Caenorhabditis elegans]|uniref:Isoform b of SET domain-containing protein 3 n=1 Tax=Caenorhabditis elegans TaxID=6239 RepID=P34318-2|nr:SET domain-containing protein 3 [Caenorhabditis elegans]CAD45581.1 SET domain-containing protein 3 [Caenorhabditis elegans]|eukprot:NP_871669.1 SET domain-containing protein 3 [Caenorhabditis elegans]
MVEVPSFRSNEHFPQLCDKVTVKWDKKRGRFVEAIEDIPIGTVVCVETGITVNVDPQNCYRCLKITENASFAYCKNCEEFYEPDEIACGEFDELGIFKLAAHLVFSYPFADIASLVQSSDPEPPSCAPKALSTQDIEAIFQLTPFPEIGEAFKAPAIQNAIKRIVESLETDENWGRLDQISRTMTFTKALRIMAERSAKNAHTIYSIEQIESQEDNLPMATGLFPISSIFNHSCTPNISGFFVRNTFIFVSQGVRAREELLDSYGVTYHQHTFEQRTNFLASVSGFICHCESCFKMKSLKVLEKPKKYPETIATNASCFTDITSYTENIPRGSKELENLIIAFARRPDSETYTELIFQFWKKFVENAKFRGITYDPYLVRPYVEMTILAWNKEVGCENEEKMSLLIVTHRLLRNCYVDLHPLSEYVRYYGDAEKNFGSSSNSSMSLPIRMLTKLTER